MKHYRLENYWSYTVIKHPILIIFTSVLLEIAVAYGARYVTINSDYRYFFSEDSPQRLSFETMQKVYSKDDSILMTGKPDDGLVFKQRTLKAIRYLTDSA